MVIAKGNDAICQVMEQTLDHQRRPVPMPLTTITQFGRFLLQSLAKRL